MSADRTWRWSQLLVWYWSFQCPRSLTLTVPREKIKWRIAIHFTQGNPNTFSRREKHISNLDKVSARWINCIAQSALLNCKTLEWSKLHSLSCQRNFVLCTFVIMRVCVGGCYNIRILLIALWNINSMQFKYKVLCETCFSVLDSWSQLLVISCPAFTKAVLIF